MRRRRGLAIPALRFGVATIGLVASCASLLVACGRDEPRPRPRLVMFGDSLLFQSASPTIAALRSRGWEVAEAKAMPGATIVDRTRIDWNATMRESIAAHRPAAVVVELGTNGCGECETLDVAIDRTMARFPDVTRVIWIGVRTAAPEPEDPGAVNRALEGATERWPQLEYVALDGVLDERRDIQSDGIHFTDSGEQRFAELVAEAVGPAGGRDD